MGNEQSASAQDSLPLLVLCVPGPWATRDELIRAIAKSNTMQYLAAGVVMMHVPTKRHCELDIQSADPNLGRSFRIAAAGRIDEKTLAAIDRHSIAPYLVGRGGSPELALEMMQFASALLAAGGYAVKVESAGVARHRDLWTGLAKIGTPDALRQAYSLFVGNETRVRSFGMHNLGMRDVSILPAKDDDPAQVGEVFLRYLCDESPTIIDGQTFSVDRDAPSYRISAEPCQDYPATDLFHNPFGLWALRPA